MGAGNHYVALVAASDDRAALRWQDKMLASQPAAVGDQAPGGDIGIFGFIGDAAWVEDNNFAIADFDNIAGQDFFLGNALAINKTATCAVVIPEDVFVIFLDYFGVVLVDPFFVDDQVIIFRPANRKQLFYDPQRGAAIVLKMKFEHGRFRIFDVVIIILQLSTLKLPVLGPFLRFN